MKLFNNLKNIFTKKEKDQIDTYDKGLEKTRKNFTSKLNNFKRPL